ncbi:MAG: succinyl-diaminopimelate desuccinylase [Actinobacteria bacterium]|nr:succinyl-diaminopimelate desuccinylase [Actinomycetota bacterium]
MTDLLGLAAELIAIPSVSREEAALADAVEERLQANDGLTIERLDDNVVARTDAGLPQRIVLAGHLDTVPPAGNQVPKVEGENLSGLGAADMKGGLAVMLALAELAAGDLAHDVTLVFYAAEEIADEHNGLRHLFADRPSLVEGDLAILLEPTNGAVEAGCQGTLRVQATFRGARAHTARPWRGENAIHKAAPVLERVAGFDAPVVEVDGLPYREALQVVYAQGGVAANVVPDEFALVVNRRFAPSRTLEQAVEEVRAMLRGADEIEVLDGAGAAPPNLSDPLVKGAVEALGGEVRAKLGWTDVARFAANGIPALNFGPGDPELAHTPGEFVTRASLDGCYDRLASLLAH